jgi:hypothetical protein
MRTLIYKRTHSGDPDPETGVFGNHDCMGQVRGHRFDAVIGIGGIGKEPRKHRIACRLTWIGIGAQKFGNVRSPQVSFRHFLYLGPDGPLLKQDYPALARRMYAGKVRILVHYPGKFPDLDVELTEILCRGKAAAPSNRLVEPNFRVTSVECRPKSRDRRTRKTR